MEREREYENDSNFRTLLWVAIVNLILHQSVDVDVSLGRFWILKLVLWNFILRPAESWKTECQQAKGDGQKKLHSPMFCGAFPVLED